MTSYARQANPVWLFTDLNGNILDDTYYAHFLQNEFPYLPQPVYQDANGDAAWLNPLQFQANGTLPPNVYFTVGQTYRIEIRQGESQADPLIYLIQDYVPVDGGSPDGGITIPTDNQITNPEFAFISFTNDYVIVNTGTNTYNIAPGWQLTLEGSATMTLTQLAFTGGDNLDSNPGYGMRFVVTSGIFTSVTLNQRFDHAPAIFSSNSENDNYVSMTLLGRSNDATRDITVNYIPSNGDPTTIINDQLIQGVFKTIPGVKKIPESTSTDTGDSGYVDISFSLPGQGSYDLSSIQLVGTSASVEYPYAQDTVERQTDYLFHIYKDAVVQQPKSNLLTGWNFALNPWQFTSTTSADLANNAYTADQTIIVQQNYVNSGTGNNIAVGRASYTDNYALEITPKNGTNKLAIIQYIDPATIRPYWGERLSALVKAHIVTSHSKTCRFKVKLIYRASLPPTIAQDEPISGWAADQEPTFKTGWTVINALNDPTYTLGAGIYEFAFNQFTLPASTDANMTLGIVIYTLDNLESASTADTLYLERVSLVHNDYAIEAAPETFDEALRKCQYYFCKTFPINVVPAQGVTDTDAIAYTSLLAGEHSYSVRWQYPVNMRGLPTLTSYSSTLTDNKWYNNSTSSGSGSPNFNFKGTNAVLITNPQTAIDAQGNLINIQITADARLGI